MKKYTRFVAILMVVAGVAFFAGCPAPVTNIEPPASLSISADNTGTRVVLTWEASPTEDIDGYIVYFKPINGTFAPIDTLEATETQYEVDPQGTAGEYHVTAYKGDNESDPTDNVSTIPYHTAAVEVYELNGAGSSGYGWDRTTGSGSAYPMSQASSADNVDFYITNFAAGYTVVPYYLASPDVSQASSDSSIVPSANWRVNGIKHVTNEEANSVLPAAGNYVNYEELIGNSYYGVHTEDGYFGLVYTNGVPNTSNGTQNIETWFQLVQGLRLINHQ